MTPIDPSMTQAEVVCRHFAEEFAPVVFAVREEPLEAADSGWQMLCAGSHQETDARVWSVKEVMERDPSTAAVFEHSPGAVLVRATERSPWQKSSRPPPEGVR